MERLIFSPEEILPRQQKGSTIQQTGDTQTLFRVFSEPETYCLDWSVSLKFLLFLPSEHWDYRCPVIASFSHGGWGSELSTGPLLAPKVSVCRLWANGGLGTHQSRVSNTTWDYCGRHWVGRRCLGNQSRTRGREATRGGLVSQLASPLLPGKWVCRPVPPD